MRTPTVFDILNFSFTHNTTKKEEYIHYSCNILPTHWDCKKGIHPNSLFIFKVPTIDIKKHLEESIAKIPLVHDE